MHKLYESGQAPASAAELLQAVGGPVTEDDERRFAAITSVEMDEQARARVTTPAVVQPGQTSVLAVHWHPEFVPMPLIRQRIEASYPAMRESLIIPTQHNELMEWDQYAGVEVDCYSRGFNQKVQLLLHFRADKVRGATSLKNMLHHTHAYRSTQLFDYLRCVTRPDEDKLAQAVKESGADDELVTLTRALCRKLEALLDRHEGDIPPSAFKNKLVAAWVDSMRPVLGPAVANRVLSLLKSVKSVVKEHFPLTYFYRTTEFIEETRALGGGVVIPHPEQFWPILLAEYDVDGVEVWNPQSQRYTEFLISVLHEKNRRRGGGRRPILVFMGDDTHMGEKALPATSGSSRKAVREIGLQPAWDDLLIAKQLILAGMDRGAVISQYRQRLDGGA